jgi:hypothetical protein
MRGGLSRVATLVARARAEGQEVRYLDVGDGLFPAGALPEAAVAQQELKAAALARSLLAMGLAVRTGGPTDDARGAAFRAGLGLPELAPGTLRLLEVGGRRLAVARAGSLSAARALGADARRVGAAFVVAVVDQPFEALLPALEEGPELDLVLAASLSSGLAGEQSRVAGGPLVKLVQVQSKGRSLARVDLTLAGGGRGRWLPGSADRERELASLDERIELVRADVNGARLEDALRALRREKLEELIARRAALAAEPLPPPPPGSSATLRLLPVESTVPAEPGVAALERAYDLEVGRLNLAWARAHGQDCDAPAPGRPGLVGAVVCGTCHPAALQVWQGTRHAQAYRALEAVGKQYHLDCIGCHVAGWQQPGGVCRLDRTAGREEVSCESCHGPGSPHLANPVKGTIARGVARGACVGCHDRDNSPAFDEATYLPRVLGPGHGLDAGVAAPR